MKRPIEIQINPIQLATLLDEKYKRDYRFLLEQGVICVHCDDIAKKGIVVEAIYLTHQNDVRVSGACTVCNGKVGRVMEFGENKALLERANDFRKALDN
jgi:hypothetical protein